MTLEFATFAASHGLRIRDLIADGSVHRVPTDDHPRKDNGAYAFDPATQRGFVQNWAVHPTAIPFRSSAAPIQIDDSKSRRDALRRRESKAAEQREAAGLARSIIARCAMTRHAYLDGKGFPEATGLTIAHRDLMPALGRHIADERSSAGIVGDSPVLIIPMRDIGGDVQSVQMIWIDGAKSYLRGGKADGAVFRIGADDSERWLCEGYATGLSVRAALDRMCSRAQVVVTFSAGNLVKVADRIGGRLSVFADHDYLRGVQGHEKRAGEAAARETGLAWCQSPVEGEDANDLHRRAGIFAVIKAMRGAAM